MVERHGFKYSVWSVYGCTRLEIGDSLVVVCLWTPDTWLSLACDNVVTI